MRTPLTHQRAHEHEEKRMSQDDPEHANDTYPIHRRDHFWWNARVENLARVAKQ